MGDNAVPHIKKTDRNVKSGIKDSLKMLYDMMIIAEDCISLLQNAFIYNKPELLQESKAKVDGIKKELALFNKDTREGLADNPDWGLYDATPDHVLRIAENIEKLAGQIRKKVDERILFSHKAVGETIFLLQRLTEILLPTADMLLARNTFLGMYIQESQLGVEQRAKEYATLHEDRLIKGLCNDASSVIYIDMLDAIVNIAWQSKEIASKLAKT
jgi:Na+/phosphate symporter